jgi:uncharacterized protein
MPDGHAARPARLQHRLLPGRWENVRRPSAQELKATAILCLPLAEVSAKARTGPPTDDEDDYDLPVWAGVIPIRLTAVRPSRIHG